MIAAIGFDSSVLAFVAVATSCASFASVAASSAKYAPAVFYYCAGAIFTIGSCTAAAV